LTLNIGTLFYFIFLIYNGAEYRRSLYTIQIIAVKIGRSACLELAGAGFGLHRDGLKNPDKKYAEKT
jgi:hypothetical protein